MIPTILIGLGGIGSTVVTRVYRQIPRKLRNLVPVHIFDTNINDLQGLKKILGEQRVTQTSRAIRVGQYLQAKDPDSPIFQWFPSGQPRRSSHHIRGDRRLLRQRSV